MTRATALVLCLFVVACSSQAPRIASSQSPPASDQATAPAPVASASASASPQEGPFGIFVKGLVGLQSPSPRYTISLVNLAGQVITQADAANRRTGCGPLVPLPNLSASNSRVYFLDGDSTVKSLAPNGVVATVMDLGIGSSQEAVFAVSPDDRRIAVAVLDNLRYPVRTQLYVEDLGTGANRADLFSGTVLEWPVGWHQASLVLAVGIESPPQNCIQTFSYSTLGYHVADATTGLRLKTICDQRSSYYPPVASGTVCLDNQTMSPALVESWDGVTRTLKNVGGCPQNGALSPDGSWIASTEIVAGSQGGCTGQNNVYLLGRNDNVSQTTALGAPEGWIDSGHLVVTAQPPGEPSAARWILDVSSNAVVQLSAVGFFAGSLPGGLG